LKGAEMSGEKPISAAKSRNENIEADQQRRKRRKLAKKLDKLKISSARRRRKYWR